MGSHSKIHFVIERACFWTPWSLLPSAHTPEITGSQPFSSIHLLQSICHATKPTTFGSQPGTSYTRQTRLRSSPYLIRDLVALNRSLTRSFTALLSASGSWWWVNSFGSGCFYSLPMHRKWVSTVYIRHFVTQTAMSVSTRLANPYHAPRSSLVQLIAERM